MIYALGEVLQLYLTVIRIASIQLCTYPFREFENMIVGIIFQRHLDGYILLLFS